MMETHEKDGSESPILHKAYTDDNVITEGLLLAAMWLSLKGELGAVVIECPLLRMGGGARVVTGALAFRSVLTNTIFYCI